MGIQNVLLETWSKFCKTDLLHTDSLNKDLVIKIINNLSEYKLIIDALFGFNFNKPLNERTQLLINSLNKTSAVKIAIDVPSGIYCDTGKIDKIAFKANRTLALHSNLLSCFIARKRAQVRSDCSLRH